MSFEIVITKHFEKKYINKTIISEDIIKEKALEIEKSIFYNGEGRVKGSKLLFKKRFKLDNTSKRRGGRILFVVFQKIQNIYIPYAAWYANDSRKNEFDENLKNQKIREAVIKETIAYMNA